MSYIAVNFDEVVEPKAAPSGKYNLQITRAEVAKTGEKSKNPGSPILKLNIGFVDHDEFNGMQHYMSLPNENDEPKSANFKVLMLKRFLEAFKIPYDRQGIDPEKVAMDATGATANMEVKQDEPDDVGNVYNRLVIPRLAGEPDNRPGAASPPNKRGRG